MVTVNMEQFREAVEQWKMLAQVGEVVEAMPVVFRKKPEEYTARIAEADRLLSIIDSAGDVESHDVSEVTRQLIERDRRGRAKYGTSLDRTDLSLSEWLQHMAEELLDGAGYALAAKRAVEQPAACDTCDGCGWIDEGHVQDDGRIVAAPEDCPRCKGSGYKAAQQPAAVVDEAAH